MDTIKTGIDLVEIDRLEQLDPAIRERFFRRVFTLAELEDCQGQMPSLAGRFAAKEAVSKALGCGIGEISWQEIEIIHGKRGQPMLKLYGNARQTADKLGLITWSISISHTRDYAVAVAVAAVPVNPQ